MTPYYSHEGITIYHGDCRDIIPSLNYGLVVSDPPYGISHESNHDASWSGTSIMGDLDTDARDYAVHLMLGHPMILFGSWKQPRPVQTSAVLIWDKGPAFGMGDLSFPWKNSFEEIYILGDGFGHQRRDPGVIRGHIITSWETRGDRRLHPNEKPLSLLKYLIERHNGQPILDPFMGSGTTVRAAKDLGRKAIGIEIEEKYCEIAAKRLSQEVLCFE